MIVDFRLKVFKTTADLLNYTHASKELCITQPAVSKHINELEKQLGVTLFKRKGHKINLTPQGERLLIHARKILNEYKNLNDEFSNDMEIEKGTLYLGASTSIAQYVLPRILAKFKKRYKDVMLVMLNGNSEQIENAISNERIDIGLIEGNMHTQDLHYEYFSDDKIVLITSAENKCSNTINLDQLKKIPLVVRENGSGTLDVIENMLAKYDLQRKDLNITMQLGSSESIKRYLLYSDTYALMSIAAVQDELKSNKLKIIEIENTDIIRTFRFVSVHGQYSKLVNVFKQFCLDNQ